MSAIRESNSIISGYPDEAKSVQTICRMSDQNEPGNEHQNRSEEADEKLARYSWLVSSIIGAGAFLFLAALMFQHFKVSPFNWPDACTYAIWTLTPLLVSVCSLWRFRASDADIKVMRQTLVPSFTSETRNRFLSFCAGLCIGSSGLILIQFFSDFRTSLKQADGNVALYSMVIFGIGVTIWITVVLMNAFRRAAPGTFKPWSAAMGVIVVYLIIALAVIPH